MSLDNIQLPNQVIIDLFKNSLVALDSEQTNASIQNDNELSFLGNNEKHIAIVVSCLEAVYLKEDELNLLVNILNACKLSMADVAIINIYNKEINYKLIKENLSSHIVLLLGVSPANIDLPLDFPLYKIQSYNNQQYVTASSLHQLINDKAEKGKLWVILQSLFLNN